MALGPGATVVCVLTGHGLKDPDIAISQISVPTVVDADLGAVLDELSLSLIGRTTGQSTARRSARPRPDDWGGRLLPVRRPPVHWCHLRFHNVPDSGLWAGPLVRFLRRDQPVDGVGGE